MVDLKAWSLALNLKLFWNIHAKAYTLRVRWFFFLQRVECQGKKECSWVVNSVLKSKMWVSEIDWWNEILTHGKFPTRKIYTVIRGLQEKLLWRQLMYKNRASFVKLLACNGKMNTKDRCRKFRNDVDESCVCVL